MCAILGSNKLFPNSALEVMSYRGPDFSSSLEFGGFYLGHNRLSIVDHDSNSNQPMVSFCGRYAIVFNGEVYNHAELRESLAAKYEFKTLSDTEVILYSYIEYGSVCVERFRGMFAFAIYDMVEQKLFCARDRLGIKPFVYYFKDGTFVFASEIKAILKAILYTPQINKEALRQYLRYLYVPAPNTIFEDINKLLPGHTLTFDREGVRIEKYWDVSNFVSQDDADEADVLSRLDMLLDESVKLRMIADVELGSFLSGGIDSSTILYYMAKNSAKKVNTYTLAFPGADKYDETNDAKIMADFFSTNHNVIEIAPDAANLLPIMVRHFDEPFGNPTAILIHELTKETKKHATVALAGDGGDEVFGGYPRYEAALLAAKLEQIPKPLFKALSKITSLIPENSSGNHSLRRIKTFIASLSKNDDAMYEDWVGYFSDQEIGELLGRHDEYRHIVKDLWNGLDFVDDRVLKTSLVDIKSFLPNNLLCYGDAMSMANSFEVRFPLIDHKVVEFMTAVSPSLRIKNGQTKYLMKKLLNGKIPKAIIDKPKLGLNPPMGMWLKKDLKGFIDDYLGEESVKKRGLLNYESVRRIIFEHESGRRDRSLYIWALIVLEEWLRQYID